MILAYRAHLYVYGPAYHRTMTYPYDNHDLQFLSAVHAALYWRAINQGYGRPSDTLSSANIGEVQRVRFMSPEPTQTKKASNRTVGALR